MKTKYSFLATGLALAGILTPLQSARAFIGYVNVTITNGYNFLANPLDVPPDNLITNVLPSAPLGSIAFLWDVPNQMFVAVGVFDEWNEGEPGVWFTPDYSDYCRTPLPPGLGFVLYSPTALTNTFVGEVLQGWQTNFVAGNNRLSLLGSKIPQTGMLTGELGFPGIAGADAQLFIVGSQAYSEACTYFPGCGWYDPGGVATTNGPVLEVARSFFVRNPGPDDYWIRDFNVLKAPAQAAGGAAGPTPEISSLTIRAGTVTLKILNPADARYNVQFSTDRRNWSTVATNQCGTLWTGPVPGSPQGYFQLVNP
jgi:hypothetical protein